jgi:hypothetical protein
MSLPLSWAHLWKTEVEAVALCGSGQAGAQEEAQVAALT